MKKFTKRFTALVCATFFLVGALFAQASTASFGSAEDVKKAQLAMSSNDYVVTPGDIYTLAFSEGSFYLSVDTTYKVRVANLGIINAKGMTLQELKNKVETIIVSNYPTSGIQFFLSNPASFNVYVKGETTSSGSIVCWALNRATDILSGFYTEYSSRRFLTVVSSDGTVKEYDTFKASRDGDFNENPFLRPDDTVIIPKLDRRVTISGEVKRPGTYELKPGEELNALIFDYANGFSPNADKDNIIVSKFVGGKEQYSVDYLKETDLHGETPLACYDKVVVGTNTLQRSSVYVEGAIRSDYNYQTEANSPAEIISGSVIASPAGNTRLRIPVDSGKTWKAFALENQRMFTNSSDLANAYVYRRTENGEEKCLPINLSEVLYPSKNKAEIADIEIETDDMLIIPFTQYYVIVNGAVNAPGRYGYQPGKDWTYYVGLANGLNLDQNLFSVVKITDKNGKKLSKKSVIPPEAQIYASRNSPAGGWLVPLLTAIMGFLTTCMVFYGAVKGFSF